MLQLIRRVLCDIRVVAALYIVIAAAVGLSEAPMASANDKNIHSDEPDLLMDALSDVVGPLRSLRLMPSGLDVTAPQSAIRRRCKGYLAWYYCRYVQFSVIHCIRDHLWD